VSRLTCEESLNQLLRFAGRVVGEKSGCQESQVFRSISRSLCSRVSHATPASCRSSYSRFTCSTRIRGTITSSYYSFREDFNKMNKAFNEPYVKNFRAVRMMFGRRFQYSTLPTDAVFRPAKTTIKTPLELQLHLTISYAGAA
jgi:hypothetical protein